MVRFLQGFGASTYFFWALYLARIRKPYSEQWKEQSLYCLGQLVPGWTCCHYYTALTLRVHVQLFCPMLSHQYLHRSHLPEALICHQLIHNSMHCLQWRGGMTLLEWEFWPSWMTSRYGPLQGMESPPQRVWYLSSFKIGAEGQNALLGGVIPNRTSPQSGTKSSKWTLSFTNMYSLYTTCTINMYFLSLLQFTFFHKLCRKKASYSKMYLTGFLGLSLCKDVN